MQKIPAQETTTEQSAPVKLSDTSGQDIVIEKSSHYSRWLWIALALGLLVVMFSSTALRNWLNTDTSVSAKNLRLAQVSRGDLIRDITLQAKVVAAVSPKLYSPADGIIDFQVNAGDSVQQQQILATINSPQLTNQLQQEQATLDRLGIALSRQKLDSKKKSLQNQKSIDLAKVALMAAEREKRRADKAFKTHAINQIDYEKAQDDMRNAQLVHQHVLADVELDKESQAFEIKTQELQFQRQQLKVQELERKVSELTLRSPVAGIVGNLTVNSREKVSQDQAILSVVDLTQYELEVQIPESYADDLAIGMYAEVKLDHINYSAQLVTISPEVLNNQVRGRVRFDSKDSAGTPLAAPKGLRQNQRLSTRIILDKREDVLMVSKGRFIEASNGRYAYKLEDGIAYRVPISLGYNSLSDVEILSGLDEKDTIIISGIERFKHAEKLLITQ